MSNRGPYDVFSENRSAPVKWGHYAQDLDKKLGPGQYNFKSFTDELQNNHQKKTRTEKMKNQSSQRNQQMQLAQENKLIPARLNLISERIINVDCFISS